MAGEAQTSKFGLGSATVMLGLQANMLDLGVAESIGLVKEVVTRSTPGFVTLTQGLFNDEVASVKNSNEVVIEGQMFEFTLRNLTYAASLEGSGVVTPTAATTTTALVAASTAATVIPVTSATGITVGSYLALHVNAVDQIFVRKVTVISALNITVERGLPVALPAGSVVRVVGVVDVGRNADQPYLSCKIVGQLADNSWVHQYYPKVRITSGIALAFRTGDFDNIPLTIKPFVPTATDPHYAWAQNTDGTIARGRIFLGS